MSRKFLSEVDKNYQELTRLVKEYENGGSGDPRGLYPQIEDVESELRSSLDDALNRIAIDATLNTGNGASRSTTPVLRVVDRNSI